MSAGLIPFLNARLDEDEAAAKMCTPSPWAAPERELIYPAGVPAGVLISTGYTASAHGYVSGYPVHSEDKSCIWADQEHIARHDPARVLREVEAKRTIVKRHQEMYAGNCTEDERLWPCLTVRALAAAYSDHPDYRAAWKPI